MSIGGYNHELHKKGAETIVVDYHDEDGFYNINLFSIKIAGEDLGFNIHDLKNPMLASGTTLFFGPTKIIKKMMDTINRKCDGITYTCDG